MWGRRQRERGRPGAAVLASVAIHLGLVGLAALTATDGAAPMKKVVVYSVGIVSPPPTALGEPPAEEPAPNEGGPAPAGDPAPTPPAAEPAAPEPAPKAAPAPRATPEPPAPKAAPVREPAPKAAPTREPPPKATPAREPAPKAAPVREPAAKASTPATRPGTTARPGASTPARPTPAAGGSSTGAGSGPRSAGQGTRGAATGRNPDANSAGGEGLNIRTAGIRCPSQEYCNNIPRQVRRFFRRPEGNTGAADVCFTVFRDGTVDDVHVERQRGGGIAFKMALIESVEQAALRKAFGPIPAEFNRESLPLCVEMAPNSQ
jgi:outer membrane biosynthesis protein TonB